MPLTFAIDFDGVITADSDLFRAFVDLLRARGHKAVIVTGRSSDAPWGTAVREARMGLPIIFAGAQWKRQAAEAAGLKIDIWVDDHPEFVGEQDPDLFFGKTTAMAPPPTSPWRRVTGEEPPLDEAVLVIFDGLRTARAARRIDLGNSSGPIWSYLCNDGGSQHKGDDQAVLWMPIPPVPAERKGGEE